MYRILAILIASLLTFHVLSGRVLEAATEKSEKDIAETQEGTPAKLLGYFPLEFLIPDKPITLRFDGPPTNFKIENAIIKDQEGRTYPKIANINVMDKTVEITVTSIEFLKKPLQISWTGGSAELAFRVSEL